MNKFLKVLFGKFGEECITPERWHFRIDYDKRTIYNSSIIKLFMTRKLINDKFFSEFRFKENIQCIFMYFETGKNRQITFVISIISKIRKG